MPIDAISSAASGSDWQLGGIDSAAGQGSGGGFGGMLTQSLQSLQNTQDQAAQAGLDLADGKATDPTAVVMAVERAQLAMQLAGQIRTKAVEAAQTLFQTQV